ncbi:acyltransferase family protein [Singulisphaera acidiphila]|uniref:Putative acyltransferase n=1 Tax=Singulisphaera acidiphila (strain ATCC BAA-1392 / DSM 18658 / VKM B-2454 / MOB10) TaxID=886293 RepID=L0DLU0_SINAD|nr:acyltransferase [Singulisphaera acidiphila]AGA30349.1 putative acyltransferase [Singulisphaera acidiphila DSM 18658]
MKSHNSQISTCGKQPNSHLEKSLGTGSVKIPELDALRGLGSIAILAWHLWPSKFFYGWSRVDLFFVLSGYLITSSILRYGWSRGFFLTFWARRALRIWPTYYLLLGALCAITVSKGDSVPIEGLLTHIAFIQYATYYWSESVPEFLPGASQTWSLAIEEQYYIVWPLIVVLAGRSLLVPIALCLIANSVAFRSAGLNPVVTLARCDGLALGAILASLGTDCEQTYRSRRVNLALAVSGIVSVLWLFCFTGTQTGRAIEAHQRGSMHVLIVNIVFFSLIGLIVLNTGHRILWPLRLQPLAYLGKISYGIFLYHLLIFETVTNYVGARTLSSDFSVVILSVLVAALSWELCEKRILAFKRLLPYCSE